MNTDIINNSPICNGYIVSHTQWKKGKYEQYLEENNGEVKPVSVEKLRRLVRDGYLYRHWDLRWIKNTNPNTMLDFVFLHIKGAGENVNVDARLPLPLYKGEKRAIMRHVDHNTARWMNKKKPVDVFFNEKSQKWEFIEVITDFKCQYSWAPKETGKYHLYIHFLNAFKGDTDGWYTFVYTGTGHGGIGSIFTLVPWFAEREMESKRAGILYNILSQI